MYEVHEPLAPEDEAHEDVTRGKPDASGGFRDDIPVSDGGDGARSPVESTRAMVSLSTTMSDSFAFRQ